MPLPTTDKLIELALHSDNEDEVFAACLTLINNEQNRNQEFRSSLINKLENLESFNRQKKIIEFTGLDSALNRQDILGKTVTQIELSAKYYKQIADRAKRLKSQPKS
ncbi:MAG: hypothetical protein EOP00_29525 [Pedobacter sp.]|nr:MAG: hypothetical protein EOP00_29525 [Pedobacter sp.]